jgi:hypothetical protein
MKLSMCVEKIKAWVQTDDRVWAYQLRFWYDGKNNDVKARNVKVEEFLSRLPSLLIKLGDDNKPTNTYTVVRNDTIDESVTIFH